MSTSYTISFHPNSENPEEFATITTTYASVRLIETHIPRHIGVLIQSRLNIERAKTDPEFAALLANGENELSEENLEAELNQRTSD